MKIGITGASGFLGSEILSQAKAKGWEIVAFSRSSLAIPGADEMRSLEDREQIDLSEALVAFYSLAQSAVWVWCWFVERLRVVPARQVLRGIFL